MRAARRSIFSGLIEAADSAEEVQGVIAHELGHITGGHHSLQRRDRHGLEDFIAVLAGIGAALASAEKLRRGYGARPAGGDGQIPRLHPYAGSFCRPCGSRIPLRSGHFRPRFADLFGKLLNREFRYGYSQSDEAASTHPLSGDRIRTLTEVYEKDPAWDAPRDAAQQAKFERVKAKLTGYIAKPNETLRDYPETTNTIPALYARAYAYHKNARVDRALETADALLAKDPEDPYFLELKGQVLLESGRPTEALDPLRRATILTNSQPLIASMLGHALIATEDRLNYEEAEKVLRAAVGRDRYNPFAWYQLGVVYAERGDMPRARLASAEQQVMSGQYGLAMRSAQFAEAALPHGSPDWLRAQDIGMQARALLERQCEMEKGRNCDGRR